MSKRIAAWLAVLGALAVLVGIAVFRMVTPSVIDTYWLATAFIGLTWVIAGLWSLRGRGKQ